MIFATGLIVLLSALLLWLGAVSPFVVWLVLIVSAMRLLFEIVSIVVQKRENKAEIVNEKAKWGGVYRHGSGLSLLPGTTVHMLITRKDEILFKTADFHEKIALKSILVIIVIWSDEIRDLSTQQINTVLQLDDHPAIRKLKDEVEDYSFFKRRPLLLIRVKEEHCAEGLITLLGKTGNHGISVLSKRPEFQEKVLTYHNILQAQGISQFNPPDE